MSFICIKRLTCSSSLMVYIVESTPARAHVVDLNQDVIQRGCGGYLYIAQFQALASLIRQRSDSVRGFRTEATGSNTVKINYFSLPGKDGRRWEKVTASSAFPVNLFHSDK